MKNKFHIIIFFYCFALICYCCNNNSIVQNQSSSDDNEMSSSTYAIETTDQVLDEETDLDNTEESYSSGYKYNYKHNGYYNYDVSGYDENGNYVSGNVDINKSGDGYIVDEEGNEKHIEVEWVGYGVMEGYDEDGVYYELEVE